MTSLASQSYPDFDIIAVDDRSTDDTINIFHEYQLRYPRRLKIIKGAPPPEGWCGKTYALYQAKLSSRVDWLVSVDADVIYSEHALTSAMEFAYLHRLDALSMLPKVVMVTFWENVVIPVMCWLALMRVSPTQANRPASRESFGYGNFILFNRPAHDSLGGFLQCRGSVLDDCALMELLKTNGFRTMVGDGANFISTRMYSSLREIIEGFGKNSFAALHSSVLKTLSVLAGEVVLIFFPFVFLWVQLFVGHGQNITWIVASISVLCTFATMLVFGRRMNAGKLFYCCYLLGYLISMVIMVYSMATYLIGNGVPWRGRVVNVKTAVDGQQT